MIAGTGTGADSKTYAIPSDWRVWTVAVPPEVKDWLSGEEELMFGFETIDCQFTGVVFTKDGNRVEVWAPLNTHDEVRRQADEASKLYPGILNTFGPPPDPEPKPDPKVTFTLESELDGDEWDLDNEEEEPEPSFKDWWFGASNERDYDEMERKVSEQLKAMLLWEGPLDPNRKRNATFNIIRDMGS